MALPGLLLCEDCNILSQATKVLKRLNEARITAEQEAVATTDWIRDVALGGGAHILQHRKLRPHPGRDDLGKVGLQRVFGLADGPVNGLR